MHGPDADLGWRYRHCITGLGRRTLIHAVTIGHSFGSGPDGVFPHRCTTFMCLALCSVAPFDKPFFPPFQMGGVCNETRSPAFDPASHEQLVTTFGESNPAWTLETECPPRALSGFAGKIREPITGASITPYASFAGRSTTHRGGPSPGNGVAVLRTRGVGFRCSVRFSSRPAPDMTGCGHQQNVDSRHAAYSYPWLSVMSDEYVNHSRIFLPLRVEAKRGRNTVCR